MTRSATCTFVHCVQPHPPSTTHLSSSGNMMTSSRDILDVPYVRQQLRSFLFIDAVRANNRGKKSIAQGRLSISIIHGQEGSATSTNKLKNFLEFNKIILLPLMIFDEDLQLTASTFLHTFPHCPCIISIAYPSITCRKIMIQFSTFEFRLSRTAAFP